MTFLCVAAAVAHVTHARTTPRGLLPCCRERPGGGGGVRTLIELEEATGAAADAMETWRQQTTTTPSIYPTLPQQLQHLPFAAEAV